MNEPFVQIRGALKTCGPTAPPFRRDPLRMQGEKKQRLALCAFCINLMCDSSTFNFNVTNLRTTSITHFNFTPSTPTGESSNEISRTVELTAKAAANSWHSTTASNSWHSTTASKLPLSSNTLKCTFAFSALFFLRWWAVRHNHMRSVSAPTTTRQMQCVWADHAQVPFNAPGAGGWSTSIIGRRNSANEYGKRRRDKRRERVVRTQAPNPLAQPNGLDFQSQTLHFHVG